MGWKSQKEVFQDAWWNNTKMNFGDKFTLISGRYMILFLLLAFLHIITVHVIYRGILELYDNGYMEGVKSFLIGAFTEEAKDGSLSSLGVLILLLLAFMLYIIKRRQQFYYGLLETIFSLANCHIASDIIKSGLIHNSNKFYVSFVTGMTTIYLLIRGLSNMREGYDKPFLFKEKIVLSEIITLDYKAIRKKYDIEVRDKTS